MPDKEKPRSVIRMAKAVELLGLRVDGPNSPLVPTDIDEVNITCPCCGASHSSGRRTLHLDFVDDWFSCPRCNFNGRVYKLVSHYTGWPYKEVEQRLRKGELQNYVPSEHDGDISEQDQERAWFREHIAPVAQRHAVYEALLEELTLSDEHRKSLRARGLSDEAIDRIGFKTLSRFALSDVIPQKLVARGLSLLNVPGFGFWDNRWQLADRKDTGFLIPSRNGGGLIEGFQIRYDHPSDSIPKYAALSSTGKDYGTKTVPWVSCVGDEIYARVRALATPEGQAKKWPPFDIVLIEGPLKAYIVNHITGAFVLAVPGVSALKMVPSALQALQKVGLRHVYIAYDMDAYTNEQVKSQLDRLCKALTALDFGYSILRWDAKHKGLDDYVTGSQHFAELLKQRA